LRQVRRLAKQHHANNSKGVKSRLKAVSDMDDFLIRAHQLGVSSGASIDLAVACKARYLVEAARTAQRRRASGLATRLAERSLEAADLAKQSGDNRIANAARYDYARAQLLLSRISPSPARLDSANIAGHEIKRMRASSRTAIPVVTHGQLRALRRQITMARQQHPVAIPAPPKRPSGIGAIHAWLVQRNPPLIRPISVACAVILSGLSLLAAPLSGNATSAINQFYHPAARTGPTNSQTTESDHQSAADGSLLSDLKKQRDDLKQQLVAADADVQARQGAENSLSPQERAERAARLADGTACNYPADWEQWAVGVLQGVGAPVTDNNLRTLWGWSVKESGLDPMHNQSIQRNPLNTMQYEVGAVADAEPYSSVYTYPTIDVSVRATVDTLNNGLYPNILSDLRQSIPVAGWNNAATDLSMWSKGRRDTAAGTRYMHNLAYAAARMPARPCDSAAVSELAKSNAFQAAQGKDAELRAELAQVNQQIRLDPHLL
jgi:hypothetical protein